MAEKLKSCPFCGGEPRIIQTEPKPGKVSNSYVFCDGCKCLFEYAHVIPKNELITGWNHRPQIKEAQNTIDNNGKVEICSREVCDYCKNYFEKETCMECIGGGYKAFDGRKLSTVS